MHCVQLKQIKNKTKSCKAAFVVFLVYHCNIQRERCLIGICPNIVGSISSDYLLLCDKLPQKLVLQYYSYFIMLMNSVGQKFIQDTEEKAGL